MSAAGNRTVMLVANRAFGVARSRIPVVRRFADAGWRVIVVAQPAGPVSAIEEAGAEFVPLPLASGGASAADSRALAKLIGLHRSRRPELVHHFNTKAMAIGSLAAVGRDTAVLHTITGLGLGLSGSGLAPATARFALRPLVRRADRVIFQNPDDRDQFVHWRLVDRSRARVVVSSGVDVHRFKPSERRNRETARVAFLGRLLRQKGVLDFVGMAERLRQTGSTAEFWIAGGHEPEHPEAIDEEWLRAKVGAGIVVDRGFVEDVPQLLAEVDVVVTPSTVGEGVPRVALEAAASALPVVATDVPGCRSAVKDGTSGYLVPPADPAALAMVVGKLLQDPALRRRMGLSGRRWMQQQFTVEQVLEQTFDVYNELLERPVEW